jgi:hypothetical protein
MLGGLGSTRRAAPRSVTAQQLLARYPARTRRLTNRMRKLLLAAVPTFSERVLPGWKAIAFRDPQAGHVCALFTTTDDVRLYIEHGASLPDPTGILRGAGTMKKGRYVPVRSDRDIRVRAITQLIRRAVVLQSL